MIKTKLLLISIILISFIVCSILYLYQEFTYPKNEWQSRHDCRGILWNEVKYALYSYQHFHDGKMPIDMYELVKEGYLSKSSLVCPFQYRRVQSGGFLKDSSPLFVSSYRLLVPGMNFDEISDGTIIVQELEGNHFESYEGGIDFPAGYHVIIKKEGDFAIEFMTLAGEFDKVKYQLDPCTNQFKPIEEEKELMKDTIPVSPINDEEPE